MKGLLLVLVVVAVSAEPKQKERYDGHSVIRVVPNTMKQLKYLVELKKTNTELDFWKIPSALKHNVDIRVEPGHMDKFMDNLRLNGFQHEVLMKDVQKLIDNEKDGHRNKRAINVGGLNLEAYHDYDDITSWLNRMSGICRGKCLLTNIGQTYEGRSMYVIKIGAPSRSGAEKPALWLDCGMHAREWVSPATCLYIIHYLISGYANDVGVKELVDHFDWFINPVANPDGYQYSRDYTRLWRKNRSPPRYRSFFYRKNCYGTDLNRNFGYNWGGAGTSGHPCSEIYRGTGPFSEYESQNIRDFINGIKSRTKLYLSFHSYGQYWLTSWGYSRNHPSDYDELVRLGRIGADALKRVHGTSYQVGSASEVLYAAAGGSDDWAKGGAGIEYSYTLELRDTGFYGFLLPESQIKATAEETWAGVKAVVENLKN